MMTQDENTNDERMAQGLHAVGAQYVALDDRIKLAKEELKTMEAAKRSLADLLSDGMIIEGAPQLSIQTGEGTAMIYPISQIWARKHVEATEEAFLQSLRDAGLSEMITSSVHTGSLSSYVRERADDAGVKMSGTSKILESLPPELRTTVAVSTSPTLGIRRKKQ
tara:strand:+ start:811 stop:1305 length:495 start_codon:yes stop_codon:yes gene_type:complete